MGDGGLNGVDMFTDRFVAAKLAELGDHLGVHVHSEKVRSDVVVQVAGDICAFFLLDGEQLVTQQAVALGRDGKLRGHAIEAPLKTQKLSWAALCNAA